MRRVIPSGERHRSWDYRRQCLGVGVALLGLCGLAACSQNFSLQPPSGEVMTVSDISIHSVHDLGPADAPYQRIADWAAGNRTGWSQYSGSHPRRAR